MSDVLSREEFIEMIGQISMIPSSFLALSGHDAALRGELTAAQAEVQRLRSVCGEAYQLAGAVGAPDKALDNLSYVCQGAPELPHATFLPVSPDDCAEIQRLTAQVTTWKEARDNERASREQESKLFLETDAALTAAREEIARLTRERDEARATDLHRRRVFVSDVKQFAANIADLRTRLEAAEKRADDAERDELHEIDQRDYREEKFGELVALFGDVQLEFSNLRGFDEIISDCAESLKVRSDAIARAYEAFRKIATFIPDTPQSHEETLEQVTMMADAGEQDMGDVVSEWERINGEIYPHTSIDAAMQPTQTEQEGIDANRKGD